MSLGAVTLPSRCARAGCSRCGGTGLVVGWVEVTGTGSSERRIEIRVPCGACR